MDSIMVAVNLEVRKLLKRLPVMVGSRSQLGP